MSTRTFKRVEVGQYEIPEQAISLIEDIQILDQVLELLGKIRSTSITVPQGNLDKANLEARQMLRRIGFLVSSMHGIAQDNLRYHFLGGRKIYPNWPRQTLAEVWRILNENKGEISFERQTLGDGRSK